MKKQRRYLKPLVSHLESKQLDNEIIFMAKLSMVARDTKREKVVNRCAKKRAELKAIVKSLTTSYEEKEAAVLQLQKLPRNASPVRMRNRCNLTGRPKGYYRKFGLGRNKLREAAMRGDVPGLVKASW